MPDKILIIAEEWSQVERLAAFAAGMKSGGDELLLVMPDTAGKLSAGSSVRFKTMEDYGLTQEYLEDEGLKWYRSFPDCGVKRKRGIKELLIYKQLSLWWLVEQQLYRSRFSYPSLREKMKRVIMLDKIIKTEKPLAVCCTDNGTALSMAVKLVCRSRGINTAVLPGSYGIKQRLYRRLRAAAYIHGLWARLLLRKVCWLVLKQKPLSQPPAAGKKLLIFSVCVWSNIRSLKTGELVKGDPYLDSVLERISGEMKIMDTDVPSGDWGLGLMREKTLQQRMVFKPFESYLTAAAVTRAFRVALRLHGQYKELRKSQAFRQLISYKGLALYGLFRDNISLFFSRGHLAMIIALIDAAERMMAVENPDVIIHYGDLPESGRAVIAAARKRGIPVLLLQHGLYDRYSHYFNHIQSDVGSKKEAIAPYCPVPDVSAVSDGYTKNILIERGKFRDEDVVITGQPRYDVMAARYNILSRERVFRMLNLNPSKKLVAWMTATHAFSPGQNRRYIDSVYNAINALGDTRLLIKLHPGEDQKAPLYRRHESAQPVITGRHGPTTFELLNAADAVITNGWCSTGIEAIILGKPLISLDFDGGLLPPYVECGAAVSAGSEESVTATLDDILHNDNTRRQLAEGRQRFITAGGYVNDGLASQRIVNLLKQMAEKQKGGVI